MADLNQDIDELLEAFFDGELAPEEHLRVQQLIESSPDVAERVALRDRVDASLQRFGAAPAADTSFLEPFLGNADADPPGYGEVGPQDDVQADVATEGRVEVADPSRSKGRSLTSRLAYAAIAAAAAWLLVGVQFFTDGDSRREVAFRERPLATVYSQCIDEGFEPYWLCEDDKLFAATFERRQGVPLQLDELPEGRRMVGLSYLAGISRESTSLLGEVDDTPVVVFIDRVDRDWLPAVGKDLASGLFIKRVERYGLVFYEVSPFAETYFIDYFSIRPEA